jgi:predicted transcriptional regulator
MPASATTKERILEAVRSLPADATADDAIERIVFVTKVEEGLMQLDAGEGIPHEEVKRRFRV